MIVIACFYLYLILPKRRLHTGWYVSHLVFATKCRLWMVASFEFGCISHWRCRTSLNYRAWGRWPKKMYQEFTTWYRTTSGGLPTGGKPENLGFGVFFTLGGMGFSRQKTLWALWRDLERFGSWCVHFVSFHICILIWWNLQFSGRSRHQDSCTVQRELIHSAPEIQGNLLRKGASLTSISWI